MPRSNLAEDLKIGHTIRTARLRRGLRQTEVAQAVAISLRTYRGYESGEASVPMLRRPLLARAVGLKPEEIGVLAEPAPPALAPDEAAWLALYHRLPSWIRALFRRRVGPAAPAAPAQEHAPC